MKTILILTFLIITTHVFGQNFNNMYPAPSHLKNHVSGVSSNLKKQIYNDYGEYTTVFSLKTSIDALKVNWLEEYECQGGVVFSNDNNKNKFIIFDSSIHGYNGQFGLEAKESIKIVKEIKLSSDLPVKELILAFQYGGNEKEHAVENNSDKPEDYFDWFVIYELVDGKLIKVYEYECA